MKNKGLQELRGISFLCIFLFHSGVLSSFFSNLAVSIFFVMSGFLSYNHYVYESCHEWSLKTSFQYAINRIKRLYPLHIAMMSLMIFRLFILFSKNHILSENLLSIFIQTILNTFLIQDWSPRYACSLNGPSWFLSACFFIYLLLPLTLSYFKQKEKFIFSLFPLLLLFQIISSLFVASTFGYDSEFYIWYIYLNPLSRYVDVLGGISLGYFLENFASCTKRLVISSSILTPTLSILIYLLSKQDFSSLYMHVLTNPTSLYNVLAVGVVLIFYSIKNTHLILFEKLGNISPNLFLIHNVIIAFLNSARGFLNLEHKYNLLFCFISFPACLVANSLFDLICMKRK